MQSDEYGKFNHMDAIKTDDLNTPKQSTRKQCEYCVGYIVLTLEVHLNTDH